MTNKELWNLASELIGATELSRRYRTWLSNLLRVARQKQQNLSGAQLFTRDIEAVLNDLNQRLGTRFTATDSAQAMIRGRLQEGYQVADFCHVHEIKIKQWKGNEKMEGCLRPSTLYRPSHFDEYLSEYYAWQREVQELAAKRKAAEQRTTTRTPDSSTPALERQALISELTAKPWHAFPSWADFMKHTCLFPDDKALSAYPMPSRIRAMRTAPLNSMLKIYSGQRIPALEAEYAELVKKHHEDPHALQS